MKNGKGNVCKKEIHAQQKIVAISMNVNGKGKSHKPS